MSVKATFNNEEYELIYNEQSGFYEIEIEAPKQGGVYNAEITFKDLIENTETSTKKIQIWAKEKSINVSKETLVYFLSKTDLEIKDVIEFENYEYIIINDKLDECVKEMHSIINAARRSPQRNKELIAGMRSELDALVKGE